MTQLKGIILAGGSGTRFYPLTMAVSKQLLPIYDKPMVYCPLTILILTGIRDILIVTTPQDLEQFRRLLGDGSQWGISLEYKIQPSPDGLAQEFILAEGFLNGAPSAIVLGDNIFFGHGLSEILAAADARASGAKVFGYHVSDPEHYGVVSFDVDDTVQSIIKMPETPLSKYTETGLYFLDGSALEHARNVTPSARGELEITSLLESYFADGELCVEKMGQGYSWLDTGTHTSLLDASNLVRALTERPGLQVGSQDEVAFQMKWIIRDQLIKRTTLFRKTIYEHYLQNIGNT